MSRTSQATLAMVLLAIFGPCLGQGYAPYENPLGAEAWWWDESWWENGTLADAENHPVTTWQIEYPSDDAMVPALVARPDDDKRYPAVLYQHGRRGLDELVTRQVKRIAARGFVVLAPDVFTARFIEKFPIEHDYVVEDDVNAGLNVLLGLPDVSTDKACLVSHTRGGFMTLKVAVEKGRQNDAVACWASYYPHMQDPNAPEAMQVYRYAPEVDDLTIPALVFIGDEEQYQRRRSIETAMRSLHDKGRPARLVVYPGVGRGFDFRPPDVRTFADDLASKDAILRLADFLREHLGSP